jgi:tRNA A58 N-methylase Trm61
MVAIGNKGCFLTVEGIMAGQTPLATKAFGQIISSFGNIIEIGGGRGGFSTFLNSNKVESAKFTSYEINPSRLLIPEKSPIDIRIANCFDSKTSKEIKENISKGSRTLLLCDGGNKRREFELFSPSLKKDDVIMCHDYCHNIEEWRQITKPLCWPTPPEVYYNDIESATSINNLKPFKYDLFKSVLWGSFVKN